MMRKKLYQAPVVSVIHTELVNLCGATILKGTSGGNGTQIAEPTELIDQTNVYTNTTPSSWTDADWNNSSNWDSFD